MAYAEPGDVRLPFDLERVRIQGSQPVRLCYRPGDAPAPSGPTESAFPGGAPQAPMLCWAHLDPGYWDLSAYATGVVEVIVSRAQATAASFQLDDLQIKVRPY